MKEYEKKELERLEKLAAEIERNPMTAKFREEEAAATLIKRTAAAAKIEDLKLDLEACGVIQREIDGMALKLAELDAERGKMKTAINEKVYCLAKEKSGIEGEIRHEEQILSSCYDPVIDEALTFYREKHDELRRPGKISINRLGSEKNIFTEKTTIRGESNVDAINQALRYCMDTIQELERMKLDAVCDTARIEALKSEIPRIDVYKESVGEKPMEKGPSPSFLARMAKEFDERINKLLAIRI